MLLKYLDIQGFKSFPDKTRVSFDRGLTAVVGPNGSGKSNISDAVRWVMGEQSTKNLRGSKMEDVIFTGTKTRKAQGFAEVSLTVDNSKREFPIDSDDVTITRKYYRSGESEYMINRGAVRLKDINEIFMDTGLGKDGYSMVGQGKIAEIVQSKSNERRDIFEEAAGISKFRYRKNESERNLINAEENLVRLRDILSELESRVEPLKEQSDKAKRFIELSDQKKKLEVSIWNTTLDSSNQALKDQSDRIIVSKNGREELEEQISQIEQDLQDNFSNMQKHLVEIEASRGEKELIETKISETTAQIAVCKNNILHNEQNVSRLTSDLMLHTKSIEDIDGEIVQKQQQIDKINILINDISQQYDQKQDDLLRGADKAEDLSAKQKELTDTLNQLILEQSQLKMQAAQAKNNVDEITASIEQNTLEHQTRVDEQERLTTEQNSANELLIVLKERLESLNNSGNGHKLKLASRGEKLDFLKLECEKVDLLIKEKKQKAQLLEGLESSLEGYSYSVKGILKRGKNGVLNGIEGTVSQLIEVNSEYSVAIETALGAAMQNIIVDNEGNAKAAINLLKQQNLGRATFLPLTSISGSTLTVDGLEFCDGYINLASNLVKHRPKFAPIVASLLGRTVIADDIDSAVDIAKKFNYSFRVVTLDGQVVNAGGSLTGGSQNKAQGLLSRKNDIAELYRAVTELETSHRVQLAKMQTLQQEVGQINAKLVGIQGETITINEDKIRIEAEINRLRQMIAQSSAVLLQVSSGLSSKREKLVQNNDMASEIGGKLVQVELSITAVTAELSELALSNQFSTQQQTQIGNELNEMNIKTIEMKKDIEAIELSIIELQKRKVVSDIQADQLNSDMAQARQSSNEIAGEIELLEVTIISFKQKIEQINQSIEQTVNRRNDLEARTTTFRKMQREASEQKEKFSSETARLEERFFTLQKEYNEIIAKLWDEYELTRSEAQAISVKLENVSRSTGELNVIKSKIRGLGSVNVAAIEEYREVSERFLFLQAQVRDAEKSKSELINLIDELTQKMQDIFLQSFNDINRNFKVIFVELFGGGRADLKLTEPDNVLESGIEIFVEPPGKIIKNLSLLSGGEQSFVAIAIYFAILKVRPAPFCVLDEIEAALDDVNVVKYANYLRSLSNKTQFIMITHRRGSMEAADMLYGVTMQDEGISKLLQLKVSEIESNGILKDII